MTRFSQKIRRLAKRIGLGSAIVQFGVSGRPRPIVVVWKLTGRCNLACPHCDQRSIRDSAELDGPEALGLIDQMAASGVRVVSITGGEPLLRPDIGLIVQRILHHSMVCKLNSNGLRLGACLDDLKGLDLLQLSMDGPRDIHDQVRGRGSFDAVVEAVKMARAAGIPTHLVCVLNRFNSLRLDETLECARNLGVRIQFQPMVQTPESEDGYALHRPEREVLVAAFRHLLAVKEQGDALAGTLKNSPSELRYYLEYAQDGQGPVGCSLVMATLEPDGRMSFCGRASDVETYDTATLGFSSAFSRLRIPHCEGCSCIGRLRFSKLCRLEPAAFLEAMRD